MHPTLLLTALALAACGPAPRRADPAADPALASAVVANNQLAVDVLSVLDDPNLFFSPFSIHAALSMLYAGAGGRTAEELASVLHIEQEPAEHHRAFGALVRDLNGDKGRDYTLYAANRAWGQKSLPWSTDFERTLAQDYSAPLGRVDLRGDPRGSLNEINGWVQEQTRGEIVDLLPSLPDDASMVLANAIVFDGDWTTPFPRSDTQPAAFAAPGGPRDVPTMRAEIRTLHAASDGFQTIGLPYGESQEVRLWIVLPDADDGLASVEGGLSAEGLSATFDAATPVTFTVYLPTLKLRSTLDLKAPLTALGLRLAWTQGNFEGTGVGDVRLVDVLHKAVVELDEDGTRASAGTVAVGDTVSGAPPPPVFAVDRPYLLVIRDEVTGTFLFVGRVSDPLAGG